MRLGSRCLRHLADTIGRFLQRQRLFFFFLRSYLVLFLLLLAFSLASYSVAIRQITANMEQTNTLVLEGICDRIDTRLYESERMAYRLTSLANTSRLALMDRYDSEFYYDMVGYVDDLWTLWLENDRLTPRMFVYFERSGIVAGPTTFYPRGTFYDRFFHYSDLEAGAFFSMLLDPSNHNRYLSARSVQLRDNEATAGTYDLLTYVYHIRPAVGLDPPGAILFLIDIREIQGMLEALELGDGGVAAIVDGDGRVLVSLDRDSGLSDAQLADISAGGAETYLGKMVYSSTASRNGWRYLALGSPRILMQPVLELQRSLFLLLLFSGLVGIGVALLQAHARSLPLDRLASRLSPERMQQEGGATGYSMLEAGVDDLLDDNRTLRSELTEIQPMMEPAILHRIFIGAFEDDEAISVAAKRIRIDLPAPPYTLVSFHTLRNPFHEDSVAIVHSVLTREVVKGILEQLTGCSAVIHEVNPMELLWIHGSPSEPEGMTLTEVLDRAAAALDARGLPIEIRFTKPFGKLSTAWWEYARLQQPVTSVSGEDDESSRFGRLVEPLLLLAYRSQDERMLGRLFDLIEREYFLGEAVPVERRHSLLAELRRVTTGVTGLPAAEDEGLDGLRTTVLEACRSAVQSRPRPGSFLHQRILDHIRRNLFRPELSLTSIADHLRISESYLSRSFKEQTGENLSGYIERLRLEEAVRLLHDSDFGVADIAERTGYASDAAFRRAFKRVHGVSPNDYRNTIPREP